MVIKKLFAVTLMSVLTASSIAAAPAGGRKHEPCSMIPRNNLSFSIRPGNGQIPEAIFRNYLQTVQAIYAPIFQRQGLGVLRIVSRWENDAVNAQAAPVEVQLPGSPKFTVRQVEIFGGLARHPLMSAEALILVMCHEIGHHMGGFPRYSNAGGDWASTEGQSDYFATAKCAREVFGRLNDNEAWVQRAPIPLEARTACRNSFPQDAKQAAICMRSSMGGLALARVLGSLRPGDTLADFSKRDRNVAGTTFESHPPAQCRLDTYFEGALCQVPAHVAFSKTDARQGACTADQRMNRGYRPTCWFGSVSRPVPGT